MNTKEFVVRIVRPSAQPAVSKIKTISTANLRKKSHIIFSKPWNIMVGSGIGFFSGAVIYLMLKLVGINYTGLESSLIIGLPAFFGLLASYVVFE